MSLAYIGIGSNLGNSQQFVQTALQELSTLPQTKLAAQSHLYRSKPLLADGDDYVNAVALIHTELTALDVLAALQAIELRHGRQRSYLNAPRTLDLDLLMYDRETIALPQLQVPHPRMTERAFVLQPLLDINPDIDIPGAGPAHSLLAALADQGLRAIS
jgi:2-amino-4-hydroxy-6-hydroxymethyldihydropteridine diphosphokinase